MYTLVCNIQILNQKGQRISYNYVGAVKGVTSINTFTDTCTLKVPRKLKHEGKDITAFIARNDRIEVKLGYDIKLKTIFKGYIKSVTTGMPITIECENEAWKLKQKQIEPQVYESLRLSDFVKEHMPGYDAKIADINLGEVRIEQQTSIAKVLEYFQKNYPVSFYFDVEGVLYAGLPSALAVKDSRQVVFDTGVNFISDDLVYTRAEDVNVQIVAKAVTRDNEKLEHKEPANAEGAEVRTFYVPGAKSLSDVKEFAKEKLENYKQDRFDGGLKAFGIPHVRKGDVVKLYDERNLERDAKRFKVEGVTYTFGQNGYRQQIKLGEQIR